jgi:hypothetical protein
VTVLGHMAARGHSGLATIRPNSRYEFGEESRLRRKEWKYRRHTDATKKLNLVSTYNQTRLASMTTKDKLICDIATLRESIHLANQDLHVVQTGALAGTRCTVH